MTELGATLPDFCFFPAPPMGSTPPSLNIQYSASTVHHPPCQTWPRPSAAARQDSIQAQYSLSKSKYSKSKYSALQPCRALQSVIGNSAVRVRFIREMRHFPALYYKVYISTSPHTHKHTSKSHTYILTSSIWREHRYRTHHTLIDCT